MSRGLGDVYKRQELDVRDYKLIRDEYFKTVAPFFKEITELLKGEESDDVKKEE